MQNSKKQNDEITKLITQIIDKKISLVSNAYNKVDENTTRFLSSSLTYTYYLLSITAASIAFVISLTLHENIKSYDLLILASLIFWIISFLSGLKKVNRTMKIMSSFSYFVLGEASRFTEISETHKKIVDDLGNKNALLRNQPLFYFLLGVFSFIVWYLIKLLAHLSM